MEDDKKKEPTNPDKEPAERDPEVREMVVALIKRTNDPRAPLIFGTIYDIIDDLAECMLTEADEDLVTKLSERITKPFTKDELDALGSSPEFILVLLAMLKTSLPRYTNEAIRRERKMQQDTNTIN